MFHSRPVSKKLFDVGVLELMPDVEEELRKLRAGHPVTFAAFCEVPWFEGPKLAVEQSQIRMRSPFTDLKLLELAYKAPRGSRSTHNVPLRLVKSLNERLGRIPTNRGIGGRGTLSALHQVVSYCWFKADYMYFSAMPNWAVRLESATDFLKWDRWLFGYHKFEAYRKWFAHEFADFVGDTLMSREALERPFFRRKGLKEVVDGHLSGKASFTSELNRALSLELTYRTLLGSPK